MYVQIVRLESGEAGLRAALKTTGGVVWAYWRGDAPTRGQYAEVELAVTKVLDWGRELQPLDDGTEQTAPFEVLHGRLERSDPDGTTELWIGGDILHVQTQGVAPPPGTRLRLRGVELTAYPTE